VILQTEMPTIPHCDELFHRYFAPWYSDDDLASRGFDATRPDMLQFSVHVGKPASALSPLHDEDQERYIHHVSVTMTDAAVGDFGNLLELSSPVDFDWIQSIDDYYNVDRIAELIAESDPTKDGNSYFITCIELGTLIAKMLQSLVPDLEWMANSPYWESSLWHPASGHIIPPTHWAIKKFSDYGWDDGLVPKIHCGAHALREATNAK
ncbi:hypothetical protein, partial [Roseiconus lacunae]